MGTITEILKKLKRNISSCLESRAKTLHLVHYTFRMVFSSSCIDSRESILHFDLAFFFIPANGSIVIIWCIFPI